MKQKGQAFDLLKMVCAKYKANNPGRYSTYILNKPYYVLVSPWIPHPPPTPALLAQQEQHTWQLGTGVAAKAEQICFIANVRGVAVSYCQIPTRIHTPQAVMAWAIVLDR